MTEPKIYTKLLYKCSKWAKSQNLTLKVTVTMKMYPKSAKSENHMSILKNA